MRSAWLSAGLILLGTAAAAAPDLAALQRERRLLIVSAPAGDPRLASERAALLAWGPQAQERDVATVVLAGASVEGAGDAASAIRTRYALPPGRFTVALVGKDGRVAFRASRPVDGAELERVIDAMPMRRAGLR